MRKLLIAIICLLSFTTPAFADQPQCCGPDAVDMYPGEYTAPDGMRLAPNDKNPDLPFYDFRGTLTITSGDCYITWPFQPNQQAVLVDNAQVIIGCTGDNRVSENQACSNLFDEMLKQQYDLNTQGYSLQYLSKVDEDGCPLSADQYAFLPIAM